MPGMFCWLKSLPCRKKEIQDFGWGKQGGLCSWWFIFCSSLFFRTQIFSSGVPSADHKAVGARQLQPGKGCSEGPALPSKPEMSNVNPLKSLLSHPCPQLRMSQAPALAHTLYTGIISIPGHLGLWGLNSCFKLNFATEICPEQ